MPPPEAPAPATAFWRAGQVDRGRRTPREEERLGAPRSASVTPASQQNRKRPPHADQHRARPFEKHSALSQESINGSLAFSCTSSIAPILAHFPVRSDRGSVRILRVVHAQRFKNPVWED